MKKSLIRATLGLSIAAGSLAMATPASATVWHNLKDETKCLGVAAGNMTNGTGLVIWDCNFKADQSWNEAGFVGLYDQLWDTKAGVAPPSPSSRCAALGNNGNINDGQQLVVWSCSVDTHDQGWDPVRVSNDSTGHACYYFQNLKAAEQMFTRVIAVGNNGNVVDGQAVVIWDYVGSLDQFWCAY